MTAPIGCLDGEQAIRDALAALPDGWGCAFVESREKEFGIVEIGHPWEDEQGLAEVITVDTENYYDSPAASKIAAFIVAANPKSIAALLAELDRLRSASRQEVDAPSDMAARFVEQHDALRHALEVIAVGDSADPVRDAGDELVALGIWDGNALEQHRAMLAAAPHQPQEAQGDSNDA